MVMMGLAFFGFNAYFAICRFTQFFSTLPLRASIGLSTAQAAML